MDELTTQVVSELYDPLVTTKYGKIRGIRKGSAYIFRGVPYAKARRFHMPEEPERWDGVLEALAYGVQCPLFTTDYGKDQLEDPHYYAPQGENCQNLNIWTQGIADGGKRPVLVWMHGGGWKSGSSTEQYSYDGEELSKFGDVVVVSINHRLNCFGYLDLSAFGEAYRYSGVAGVADLTAALKWVHENIEAFGGDPENVTIAGQSGGSAKVYSMLQTPAADGLFQRVIADGNWELRLRPQNGCPPEKYAARFGQLTAECLGIAAEEIEKIETVPYYDLMDACRRAEERLKAELGVDYKYEPVPGGDYWLGHPFDVPMRPETLHIPLLLGGCFAEHYSNVERPLGDGFKNRWEEAAVRTLIDQEFGQDAGEILEEYGRVWPDRPLVDVLFADRTARRSVLKLAKMRAEAGGSVWVYRFNWESPVSGGMAAWHCSELHFLFHNAQYNEASYVPGVTEELQDKMCGAWLAFMKTGGPGHPGLPVWPKASADQVPTMEFDKECTVRMECEEAFTELLAKHK